MLKINDISKSYKHVQALSHINLELDNKIYGLLGPNGSGKTTLLRILAGVLKPDEGNIYTEKKGMIGYLPQKYGVFKEMTLYDQLYYYSVLKEIPKSDRAENIKSVLEDVNLEDMNQKCGSLSGGMVRRAGIAQAFLGQPDYVLLDEPTAGLDIEERLRFKQILLKKRDYPIIVSTHIVEDVESVCDELIILSRGKIRCKDTPARICEKAKDHVYELAEEDYKQLTISHYVIRIFTKDDKKYYRIICDERPDNGQAMQPEIEDGYMYILKGPFLNEKSA